MNTLQKDFEALFLDKDAGDKFSAIHKREMEEVLDNLGYIQLRKVGDRYEAGDNDLAKGISLFRTEYEQCKRAFPEQIHVNIPKDSNNLLTEEELEFLNSITSLEGDFDLHKFTLAEIAINALLSRILKWRLSVLGFIPQELNPALPANLKVHLDKLQKWSGAASDSDVIRYTGDVNVLSCNIVSQPSFADSNFHHIAYFINDSHSINIRNREDWFKLRFQFIPSESTKIFEQNAKRVKNIEPYVNDELNQLMIRLVQLKLWTLGTYDGILDNDMGPRTLEGIDAFKEYLNENYAVEAFDISNLLFDLSRGHYAINVTYMFRVLFPVLEERQNCEGSKNEKHATISQRVGQLIEGFGQKEKDEVLGSIKQEIDNDLESEKVRKRKTKNRESKNLFRSIGRYFARMGELIKEGVKKVIEALKKFFRWFKNAAKIFLREVKKIFNMVREAMSFFFSKREVPTQAIKSDFDGNFDCMTYVSEWEKEHIEMHIQKNIEITHAMNDVSLFLGTVISVAIKISKGPFGWLQLGIEIISYLAKEKFSYYRLSFHF